MPDANRSLAESVISLFAGPEPAAAIYGDLTEMAATRSRLWFWMAYARTLVALSWRTPIAVLAAVVSVRYVRQILLGRLFYVIHAVPRHPVFAGHYSHLAVFSWIVSLQAEFTLWTLLPYLAIRFGLRNRLTYLAGILLLFGLPVYTLRPQVYQFTGLICAVIIVAALAFPVWRRPMIFLLANYPIHNLTFYVCVVDPLRIFHPHHYLSPMGFLSVRIDEWVGVAITIMISPPLYRWLLQPRPTGGTHVDLA